jgi:feruloyl esterase
MDLTKQYPRKCEMQALTMFAIDACDALDGVKDGLISDPEKCRKRFIVREYLERSIFCSEIGGEVRISAAAVDVTRALLDGPRFANGDFMWFGYEPGTEFQRAGGKMLTFHGLVSVPVPVPESPWPMLDLC